MKFQVKQFAQLMLLSHGVTLSYDLISGGDTMIDLYEIIERPQIVKGRVLQFMEVTYEQEIGNKDVAELYQRLCDAKDDAVFQSLLKIRNENLRGGINIF